MDECTDEWMDKSKEKRKRLRFSKGGILLEGLLWVLMDGIWEWEEDNRMDKRMDE